MSRNIRDVSPILQKVRDFLLGRRHTLALRFQDECATRSPPLPDLPDGPSHLLSANYYYSRDARREVCPPEVVASSEQKMIEGAADACGVAKNTAKGRTPGKVFHWD